MSAWPGAARPARRLATLAALVLGLAACSDPVPESSLASRSDSIGESEAEVARARYLTHFAFAGVDGRAFFGSFGQQTEAGALVRVYDAWLGRPAGWSSLVRVRDTIPVPRAAWRILPAGGMGVRVGDSREVVGLSFATAGGRVALHAGDEVEVWTGPTGQRESVGVAGLEVAGDAVAGILFFRRAARALQFPGDTTRTLGFVLADPDGNGLLIEAGDDGTAVARTYLHGNVDAWDDIVFRPDSTVTGAAVRRWSFEIPMAQLTGAIRTIASPATGAVPALRVECDLFADGEVFRFAGLSVWLPLP